MSRSFVAASSQYLSNASYTPLDGVQKFSVSAWLQRGATAGSCRVGYFASASSGWQLTPYTGGACYFIIANGSFPYAYYVDGVITTMRQMGMVFDGTQATSSNRLLGYISGAAVGLTYTDTIPVSVPTIGNIEIGRNAVGPEYTDGTHAEVAIWDIDLTAAEMAMLGLGYSPLFVRPQNLVSYWPLIGRTSPEIDVVGGYGLTLVNAPAVADHVRVFRPAGRLGGRMAATVAASDFFPAWGPAPARLPVERRVWAGIEL